MSLIQMAANQIFPLCSIVKPKARPSKYWTLRPSAALSKTHKPLQVFVILVFALKRSANLDRAALMSLTAVTKGTVEWCQLKVVQPMKKSLNHNNKKKLVLSLQTLEH